MSNAQDIDRKIRASLTSVPPIWGTSKLGIKTIEPRART